MKKFAVQVSFVLTLALMAMSGLAQAQTPMHTLDLGAVECNWGIFTAQATTSGFPTGDHARDPDGDGIGNNDPDHHDPRTGLPRALGGSPDLETLCEILGCVVFPDDPLCQ